MSHSFIYIVESPSPNDLFDGRTEGRALCETLNLAGHKHSYTVASNINQLSRAFDIREGSRFATEWQRHRVPPVIHLSAHGNTHGIQLTDGTVVSWHDLRTMLMPINDILSDGVLICFSTCEGASSGRMSMYLDDTKPFWATVGSCEAVHWDDALVGFTAFYHAWFKGHPVATCIENMKVASCHGGFICSVGQESKNFYKDYVLKQQFIDAITPATSSAPRTEGSEAPFTTA